MDFEPQGSNRSYLRVTLFACVPEIQTGRKNRVVRRFTSRFFIRFTGEIVCGSVPGRTAGCRPRARKTPTAQFNHRQASISCYGSSDGAGSTTRATEHRLTTRFCRSGEGISPGFVAAYWLRYLCDL